MQENSLKGIGLLDNELEANLKRSDKNIFYPMQDQ